MMSTFEIGDELEENIEICATEGDRSTLPVDEDTDEDISTQESFEDAGFDTEKSSDLSD